MVNPAEKFGGPFDNCMFRAYPFCLPILVGCFGLCMAFIGVYLYLPETLLPPPPPLRQALARFCGKAPTQKYAVLPEDEDQSEDSDSEGPPAPIAPAAYTAATAEHREHRGFAWQP